MGTLDLPRTLQRATAMRHSRAGMQCLLIGPAQVDCRFAGSEVRMVRNALAEEKPAEFHA